MDNHDHYSPVEVFVRQFLPGLRGEQILRADRLLESIQYSEHVSIVERIISYSHDSDTQETVDRIEDTFRHILDQFIREHQITIDLTRLEIVNDIFEFLYQISDFEDIDAIEDRLDDQAEPSEVLVDLLCLYYSDEKEIDFRQFLIYVNPSVVDSLKWMIDNRRQSEYEQPVEVEMIEKQRKLRDYLNNYPAQIVASLIDEEQIPINQGIRTYLEPIFDAEIQGSAEQKVERYAAELVGAFLASDMDSIDQLISELESYSSDLLFVQKLIAKIGVIRGELGL